MAIRRLNRLFTAALLTAACAAAGPVLAQSKAETPFAPDRLHVTLGDHAIVAMPGQAQLRFGAVSPISIGSMDPADPSQTEWELTPRLRARLSPSLILTGNRWPVFQFYQVAVDVDARWALAQPETPSYLREDPENQLRRAWDGPRITQAYALLAGKHAAIKLGMTRSSWGTGMLANPGTDHQHPAIGSGAPPDVTLSQSPFGYGRFVDRVARFQVGFFPLGEKRRGAETFKPLTVAVAADMVLEDGTASWDEGDRTYQGIVAIFGRYERLHLGLYGVYRNQTHKDDGGSTEVGVVDLSATYRILNGAYDVWLDGELAFIFGNSTFSKSVFHPGPLDVFSWGGTLRFGFASACFEGVFEFAAGSGDNNPFDEQIRGFNFNREFRAGLLMFREVLRTTTAVGAANVADPTFRGAPPAGYERIASGGAIQGATLFFPRIGWEPVERLKIYAGVLLGSSTVEYTDPFWTGNKGGVSSGPHGATEKGFLGVEVDLAVRYTFESLGPAVISIMAEFAYFQPGSVFSWPDGTNANDVFGAWAHVEARF